MANRDMNTGPAVVAFLIGSAVGLAAGMLFAPKSGKQTRDDIQGKVKDGVNLAHDKVEQGRNIAKAKLDSTVATAKTVVDESKRAAKEAKNRVSEQRAASRS